MYNNNSNGNHNIGYYSTNTCMHACRNHSLVYVFKGHFSSTSIQLQSWFTVEPEKGWCNHGQWQKRGLPDTKVDRDLTT